MPLAAVAVLAAVVAYRDYRRGIDVAQLRHALQQVYLHNPHLIRPTRTIPFQLNDDEVND